MKKLREIVKKFPPFNYKRQIYHELPGIKGVSKPYMTRPDGVPDPKHGNLSFNVHHQGHLIATSRLSQDKKSVTDIWVRKDWRRKGVASALYNHIEGQIGHPLEPSRVLSPEGQEFWKARKRLV